MERGRVECVFNIVAAISTWLVAPIKLHMAAPRGGEGHSANKRQSCN